MKVRGTLLSFILVILMTLNIVVAEGTEVYADGELPFANITLDSKGVLSWEAVSGVYQYTLRIEGGKTVYNIHFSENRFDVFDYMCKDKWEDKTYSLKLTVTDDQGRDYLWTGTYDFVNTYPKLIPVSNIRIQGQDLVWDYDSEIIPDSYKIYVDRDGQTLSLETTEARYPLDGIFLPGTYDYTITIKAVKSRYPDSDFTTEIFKDLKSEVPAITGLKHEGAFLSWNAFPNATGYKIELKYTIGTVTASRVTKSTGNEVSLGSLFGSYDGLNDLNVEITVTATSGDYLISAPGNLNTRYTYEIYPLHLFGKYLDSRSNLTSLLPDKSVKYDPSADKLIFNDTDLDRDSFSKTGIMFQTDGPLSIEGNASIDYGEQIFDVGGDLVISPDSSFKLNSDAQVLSAGSLRISGNTMFEAVCSSGKPAVSASGKIVMKGMHIAVPKDGKLSIDSKTICNADGSAASKVKIIPATPTPTATPIPTATPTSAPSAKPTKAPARPTSVTPVPSTEPSDPKAQILSFVERIYIYVLDREPEADGAAFWSDELYSFRRTGAEVAQGFIFSPEFEGRGTSDEEFVTILYKTFFGRDPEEGGMKYWLEQLSTGSMDRVTVANGFIYSQEWADTCASYGIRSGGDLKPTGSIEPTELTYAFVERMYTTAMGRGYDEVGKQYWAGELSNFNVTGEACGAAFFLSDEMVSYDLSDKDYLGRLYATFMNREPDADGENYWLGVMASGTSRSDVVFGFTRSPEFTEKCIEARILPY